MAIINAVPNHGGSYNGPAAWTGNWSDPLMWDAQRVPAAGDIVQIYNYVPVITVDIDADIGHSPGTNDSNFALSVGLPNSSEQGSLIVASGVTLRVRGDFFSSGLITMMPGSTLILDATNASNPSGTRYVVSIDPVYNGTVPGYMQMLGTNYTSGLVTITTGTNSQMPILFDGYSFRRGSGVNGGEPDYNAGEIQGAYTRFYRVGDGSAAGIQTRAGGVLPGSSHTQVMVFNNCVFDTCGGISWSLGLDGTCVLNMTNTTFKNSPALSYNQVDLTNTPALTESLSGVARIITHSVFDQPVSFTGSVDFELHDNIHLSQCQTPDQTSTGTYYNNMLRRTDTNPGGDFLWKWRWGLVQHDNFYFIDGLNAAGGLANSNQSNPHWGCIGGGIGYGASKNNVLWYAGDDAQGDMHIMTGAPDTNNPSGNIYEIAGCISLPNLLRSSSGCFTTVLGGYAIGGTVVSHNNTIAVGHGSSVNLCEGGHHLHESTDDFTGEFGRISSNIVWADPYDQSSLRGGTISRNIGGGTTPTDPISPANIDYNVGWYIDRTTSCIVNGSTTTTPGYDGITFSAAPGVHDQNANPQFVDNTRNIITWAVANGQSAPSSDSDRANLIVYAMDQMALVNDTSYNPIWSYANLLAHIRAGFVPTNPAMNAAHPTDVSAGFTYAGAMPVGISWVGYTQTYSFS